MPLLGFHKRFANAVECGDKLQTIRAIRKRPFKVGDRLFLYTGCRTSHCRRLGEGMVERVRDIRIEREPTSHLHVSVGAWSAARLRTLRRCELVKLARDDGFPDIYEFYRWFVDGINGQIINWKRLPRAKWKRPPWVT